MEMGLRTRRKATVDAMTSVLTADTHCAGKTTHEKIHTVIHYIGIYVMHRGHKRRTKACRSSANRKKQSSNWKNEFYLFYIRNADSVTLTKRNKYKIRNI